MVAHSAALFDQTMMSGIKFDTTIMIALHHVGRVCGSAVDVNIVATHALNEPRGSPHADAPTVARVRLKKGVKKGRKV